MPIKRSLGRTLQICADHWRLHRAQRYEPDRLRRLQEEKLRRIVDHAWRTVPFYRERFTAAGVHPADLRSLADFERFPLIRKADLQAAGLAARTSSEYRPEQLDTGVTSGSTGQPFPFGRDPFAMRLRKALFLRALLATGYRPGQRLLLLDAPRENLPPAWLRWRYVRPTVPVEEQFQAIERFRPAVIYTARPTTLALLARFSDSAGRRLHRPKALVTTGETLGDRARSYIQMAFGAPVFDVYGAVEAGTIAWECPAHRGLHIAEESVILEFLPSAHDDVRRVVLTNLENRGMPLIRYDIGDLGVLADEGPCPCGTRFRRIARIEGRLVDCVLLPDGRLVPPSRFEHAIKRTEGVDRFQVLQSERDMILVRFQGRADTAVADAVQSAVGGIVGGNVRIRVQWEESLDPPPGRKFRLIERDPSIVADLF